MNISEKKNRLKKFHKNLKPESGFIHFIGLGGIGMSALAKILLELGYKVSGSDIKINPILNAIQEQGAVVKIGQCPENIKDCSLVVVSTAIKADNPELKAAQDNNIEIIHRSQLLEALLSGLGQNKKPVSIGITGTHGKTTTTGMITHIFNFAEKSPSFAIGGKLPETNSNSSAGKGNYFIAELDESDKSIELYTPDINVITNLEFDHADHYEGGFEQILQTFELFVKNLSEDSKIIINIDDNGNKELLSRFKHKNIISYSIHNDKSCYKAEIIEIAPQAKFNVYKNNVLLGKTTLGVAGEHNISNALAAITVSLETDIDFEKTSKALESFIGVNRRFQKVGIFKGASLIDDYAHHPTEVEATVKTAKELIDLKQKGRVIAVFQPHRYSRLANLWEDFSKSFTKADLVYIVDVYPAGENPIEGINSEEFAKIVKNKHSEWIKGDLSSVAEHLSNVIAQDDIVLTMGAGSITQLGSEILKITGEN